LFAQSGRRISLAIAGDDSLSAWLRTHSFGQVETLTVVQDGPSERQVKMP
jgi:hypothetical protein